VVAEHPNPLISSGQTERRPAIWPWLVMPLVALTMYFALDKIHRVHVRGLNGFATESRAAPDNDTAEPASR
jgi:hypothetical protein